MRRFEYFVFNDGFGVENNVRSISIAFSWFWVVRKKVEYAMDMEAVPQLMLRRKTGT